MSEDIEAKIRRLRELGKASAESEPIKSTKPIKPKPSKPSRRISRIGSVRERERRKRILIGSAIIIIIVLAISWGVYSYYKNAGVRELEQAKNAKIAEVDTYFKGNIMNFPYAQRKKAELLNEIAAAQSIEDVKKIDVKAAYQDVLRKYQQALEEQKRIEQEKILNETKREKIDEIKLKFEPLLSRPLPQDIRKKAISVLKSLEDQVMSAKTVQEINSTTVTPYLLELWKEYYYFLIDNIPTQNVILEKAGSKKIYTKDEAKTLIGSLLDYKEIMQYHVGKVEMVDMALVLPRSRINGAFVSPGDKIVIFSKNSTNSPYTEIANMGYVEMVLLPKQAGIISAKESQSQSSSSSTSSSDSYSEQHSRAYTPAGTSISNGQSSSDAYSSSQTSSQSSSAAYNYNVDLSEILKAVAAGKIKAADEVKKELESYGWEVVDLEKLSGMLVMDANTQVLVIIKVPSVFVPDILSHQNFIYIAKVSK